MNNEDKIHINSFKFYDRDELEELTKQYYLENKELKKQLEKKYEKLYEENTRLVNEITVLKTENQKLKEMQREFIDWLEIRIKDRDKVRKMYELYSLSEERLSSQYFVLQDVLLKYKEIIGGKNK